jgi:hypothetical protein
LTGPHFSRLAYLNDPVRRGDGLASSLWTTRQGSAPEAATGTRQLPVPASARPPSTDCSSRSSCCSCCRARPSPPAPRRRQDRAAAAGLLRCRVGGSYALVAGPRRRYTGRRGFDVSSAGHQ